MPITNFRAAAVLTLVAVTLGYLLRTRAPVILAILESALVVVIYRLTWHPLAGYPGPWLAAATDWYSVYYCLRGDRHLDFYRLHEQYGPAVRFGPNRVSFRSARALTEIYGSRANTQKSAVYRAFSHFFTVPASLTTIDRKSHVLKRRLTSRALSGRAVQDLEELILQSVRLLCRTLTQTQETRGDPDPDSPNSAWGPPHDLTTTLRCLLSDVMGDVTFSRHWSLQTSPRNRPILSLMAQGTRGINVAGHMPMLLRTRLERWCAPALHRGVRRFYALSAAQAEWRAALLDARDPETGAGYSARDLVAEAGILIIAGTDTTATALTATLFYLLHDSCEAYRRAQAEVRAAFADLEAIRIGPALAGCTFLYACVDEALRLSPPVGSVLPREVLPGGLTVSVDVNDDEGGGGGGGEGEKRYFVPAGTDVGVPVYALHHDARYWRDPHAFRPERWLTVAEDKKKDGSSGFTAYAPFGAGGTSCVGRYLAYQEIGIILARLLWLLDIRLAPGLNDRREQKDTTAAATATAAGPDSRTWGRHRAGEFQTRDVFTSAHEGPWVQFRPRDAAADTMA
ncbi:benzoate 4-monooxygenase cytochrome-like protein P450 [Aspergillus aculeatinus CBS 121060]|uniref:Benzoate 4-monooxygenase cytochrome-like protein P450 n=1 Tax=Aspergillus aculeatinus CBS 121060 TaxID=1448322 RepID=A0ACD1GYD3_9EURO|nr:benzoate 4-monooxygenase cytochrome-like protein P450 [Aspergillus aculeatinus CBS 121060]RAH66282.1 benzoate 4-monooxygenase cytochrome-like protein P450 [Aspergillus aculeatinus CBS 121060]